jgi:DNA-binding transcriptional LysR family regulator
MRMTLRQMEYFVAVAERGSIAAAAAELPISESAVSVAISELESIVGVRLLHRVRARGVTLTAAGTALLPELGRWWHGRGSSNATPPTSAAQWRVN